MEIQPRSLNTKKNYLTEEGQMNIPFVDLKTQYASIKKEIDTAVSEVISNTAFVGGPFLKI